MKAPDKVFFPNDINLMTKLSLVIQQKGDVCYIRKDALLEWAKEQRKDCECTIREHPEDESLWCERDKYEELIDKINSL